MPTRVSVNVGQSRRNLELREEARKQQLEVQARWRDVDRRIDSAGEQLAAMLSVSWNYEQMRTNNGPKRLPQMEAIADLLETAIA